MLRILCEKGNDTSVPQTIRHKNSLS